MFSAVESHMPLAQFPMHPLEMLESRLTGGGGEPSTPFVASFLYFQDNTLKIALVVDDRRG